MQPLLRGLFIAATLVAVTVPMVGCDVEDGFGFRLEFRDFDSNAVEGIRLWKRDLGRGVWDEALVLEFGAPVYRGGIEFQTYTAPFGPDGGDLDLFTKLVRFGDGDVVRLSFGLLRLSRGNYKISAFNALGDSRLSAATLTITTS